VLTGPAVWVPAAGAVMPGTAECGLRIHPAGAQSVRVADREPGEAMPEVTAATASAVREGTLHPPEVR
jgi:hypothetical protein